VEFFSSSAAKPTKETQWAFPIPCKARRYCERLSWLTAAESERTADNIDDFPFPPPTAKPTKETRWAFPIPCKARGYCERLSWLTAAESEGTADNIDDFPFPPSTDYLLKWLGSFLTGPCDERDMGYDILPFQERRHRKLLLKRMKGARSRTKADILWLSTTEFVSLHRFHTRPQNFDRYSSNSYAISVNQWKLLAYSLPQLDNADGTFRFGPVSDLPLRFLYFILAPVSNKVSALEIELENNFPVMQHWHLCRGLTRLL
jgi:hypothetical protein